jgi:hypothetical protein
MYRDAMTEIKSMVIFTFANGQRQGLQAHLAQFMAERETK